MYDTYKVFELRRIKFWGTHYLEYTNILTLTR